MCGYDFPPRVQPSGVSVLKFSFLPERFLRNDRSSATHPPQSTVLLLLRDFGLLNQINGPSAPSSINDRDIFQVFRPFPPLFSSRVLDLAPCVHLHIDDSRRFGFPDFRKSQISTLIFPQWILSRIDNPLTRVPLGSTTAIPSCLRTSDFSVLNFHSPSTYANYCRVSSRIRRLIVTSGLYPKSSPLIWWLLITSGLYSKSIDLFHVSSRSDGPDSLRVFGLRKSQFSIENPMRFTQSSQSINVCPL
jgi:hypothetical protein